MPQELLKLLTADNKAVNLMKTEKKHVGIKAEFRAKKGRKRRLAAALFIAFILLIIVLSAYSFLNVRQVRTMKAAIVDQLAILGQNQTFITTVTNILQEANYTVDYYSAEKVTVEFYRDLPNHEYDLIILRVHSVTHDPEQGVNYTGLFTSEAYDEKKYVDERITKEVGKVAFLPYHEGDPVYFGISSLFLYSSMDGRFDNTTVIMMGCWTLTYPDLAEAFIAKGAGVCIGWSDSVLLYHTDEATVQLLRRLVTQKQTVEHAVNETNEVMGPDPESHAMLGYYPPESGSHTIAPYSIGVIFISPVSSAFDVSKRRKLGMFEAEYQRFHNRFLIFYPNVS